MNLTKKKFLRFTVIFMVIIAIIVGMTSFSTIEVQAATGYKIKYNKVTITMGSKAKKFINAAGTPKEKKTSKSCAYDGKDITRYYNDFILYTYTNSNKKSAKEYVQGITFLTSNIKVKKYGIKIGSTEKKVKKKLGKKKPKYGVYTYYKGKTKLQIEVNNGKVTNIRCIKRS